MSNERTFQKRYGEYVNTKGYWPLPRLMMWHVVPRIHYRESWMLIVLLTSTYNDDLTTTITHSELSRRSNMAVSMVKRAVLSLEDRGLIEVHRPRKKAPSTYSLIPLQRVLSKIGENLENGATDESAILSGVEFIQGKVTA